MSNFAIRRAGKADGKAVFKMVSSLLREIDPDLAHKYVEAYLMPSVEKFLSKDCGVYIFIAEDKNNEIQGLITLNECRAIYAFGEFGEISELYVSPNARSSGLGERLIECAENYAFSKGWSQLEVGAPSQPKWQRSVDFYHRCGYATIGPRLYKWLKIPD